MIFFLATKPHRYTMRRYLRYAEPSLRRITRVTSYQALLARRSALTGAYIFSDLDRMTPGQAEAGAGVWSQLERAGATLLNHPTRSMQRYELLRNLRELGMNDFDVYRLTEARSPSRYPVFLRREHGHMENMSPLLPSAADLRAATEQIEGKGINRNDVLITEFVDTSDSRGIYRKYSAFRFGKAIVPGHLYFSREWMFRTPYTMSWDSAMVDEERAYVELNPHEGRLQEIFELARVEYGRIDYGVGPDGRIQVWEINLNPTLLQPSAVTARASTSSLVNSRIGLALLELDRGLKSPNRVKVQIPTARRDPTEPSPRERLKDQARAVLHTFGMEQHEGSLKRPITAALRLVSRPRRLAKRSG